MSPRTAPLSRSPTESCACVTATGWSGPYLAKPGEIYPITIDAGVPASLFRAGHRIRLEIASSNFPRFDRNPNTGRPIADETHMRIAHQTVLHGGRFPSALLLPVVSRHSR